MGAGVVECALSDLNCYVSIVAATDYPTTDAIDGFMPGNQITFKFWDHSESEEIDFVNSIFWQNKYSKNDFIAQENILSIFSHFYNDIRRKCISVNEILDENFPEIIMSIT